MFDQLVWILCIATEVTLLARTIRTGLLRTFPIFYGYIACVLAKDVLSVPIYRHASSVYPIFYYAAELVLAAIGYGVLSEIYSRSLKAYAGVSRFFRLLLVVAFLIAVARVSIGAFAAEPLSFGRAVAELEQLLRQLQAALLCCLFALFMYYKIPTGKNLRGIITGYSLLVSTDVIMMTFAFNASAGFGALMRQAEPAFYLISLFVWMASLWSVQEDGPPVLPCRIEQDYERLAALATMVLLRARAQLERMVRA
jgi:hypothetical protein